MSGRSPPLTAAGPAHAAPLAALHAACFDDAWDEAAMTSLLAMPGTEALIAGPVAAPAGFVLFRVAADEAEIITLGVPPDCRRAGVGAGLLAAALERAAAAGAVRMVLEVADDNTAAQALYRAAGFVPIGRRQRYYARGRDVATDATILARGCATAG